MNFSLKRFFSRNHLSVLFLILFSSLLFGQSTSTASTANFSFTRYLSVGSTGEDVRNLQKILNSDPQTRVSLTGAGSPGQESDYFGAKTASALIKYQEKHREDILIPAGITSGTGKVGLYTMTYLNRLPASVISPVSNATSGSQNVAKNIESPIKNGVIPQKYAFHVFSLKDLLIFGTSHTKIKTGDSLALVGYGFDKNTTVHIGSNSSIPASPSSDSDISIKIPNIPQGTYDLWVENDRGNSQKGSPTKITIADQTDARPSLISVSPESAHENDTITVRADKLDPTGNNIYTTIGVLKSVPSYDGHTMTFKVSDLPNAKIFFSNTVINSFIVTFGIMTHDGLSLNYGTFTLIK
jgi:peptidoglycan hydrolase-like protein with peptidoglycan-binding domain